MTSNIPPNSADEREHMQADLFEAISHPTRILLLKILKEDSMGFASLKHALGITSSGNLQHHLHKLDTLITTDDHGKYTLTDAGREAVFAILSLTEVRPIKSSTQAFILISTLSYYVVQLNIDIILGNVDLFTPVKALATALLFGVIQWAMWKVILQRRTS
jgi:hypothetical protein